MKNLKQFMEIYSRYKKSEDIKILSKILNEFILKVDPYSYRKEYNDEIAENFITNYKKKMKKVEKLCETLKKIAKSIFFSKLKQFSSM